MISAAWAKSALSAAAAGLAEYALTGYGNVERLQDVTPPELRLRVGVYRVRFYDYGDYIQILRVLHRREAYR